MDVIKKLEKIIPAIATKFGAIEVLYLFGSYASGNASSESDVDIAVVVDENRYKKDPLLDLRVGVVLEHELESDVDVVVMNRVSPIVQHEVLRSGKRLFERMPQRRAAFELKSFKEYVDARYYQRKRFYG